MTSSSPRERAQLMTQLRQQQEALVRDLLPVLDALDRADQHWQQWRHRPQSSVAPRPKSLWLRLRGRLARWLGLDHAPAATNREEVADLVRSAGEGISLIRGSLLDALQRHGLEPIESLGQPFDPERMRALGQSPAPAGTAAGQVVEEAMRGYLWRQSLLREAQVLVAAPPPERS